MSKDKPFKNEIKLIYKATFEDNALYFYYVGIKQLLPNVPDNKIIAMWLEKMGFSEDEYSLKTALGTLLRMKKLYSREQM